jgi:hypothetical protein
MGNWITGKVRRSDSVQRRRKTQDRARVPIQSANRNVPQAMNGPAQWPQYSGRNNVVPPSRNPVAAALSFTTSQFGTRSRTSSSHRFSGVATRPGIPTIAATIRMQSSPAGAAATQSIEYRRISSPCPSA